MNDAADRIDLHMHITPGGYVAELERMGAVPDHGFHSWSRELTLETMDRWGTAAAVLSLTPPGVSYAGPTGAARLARSVNEEIAEVVRHAPARLGGLAVLPLPNVDAALEELAYALDELRLDGVELYTNVDGIYLGDSRWDALFDELDARGAFVLVHPAAPPYRSPVAYPNYLIEFPMDTTRAVVSLLYSGTLHRCPNVKLLVSHLGGMVPFVAHRIRSLTLRTDSFDANVPDGPLTYLQRLYYDTGLSANEPALRATLAITAVDHVVYGTDWPYAEVGGGADDPQPGLTNVLTEDERWRVTVDNPQTLVPRLAAALAAPAA
jgi:predicted TIM-barrel fold metal-dependent hydrolase